MKINPGPKGLLPWTDAEKEEGQRLASMLSPAEVYLSLTVERCKRYEAAIQHCEKSFARNKTRMWVLKILREQLR